MLEIKNVTKKFGKKVAVNNVSLCVADGSICALVGLNGAGKSTLMKVICSLLKPCSGEVLIDGKNINSDRDNRNIGYMIECPAFYGELTGRRNLLVLKTLYPDIKAADVDNILSAVGLQGSANVAYKKYSLGMKQRLYFAYALLNKPSVLVLDEPLNGIDPVSAKCFKDSITALAKVGCSILISSHIIMELQSFCDSIAIINEGELIYFNDKLPADTNWEQLFLSKVCHSGAAQ